MLSIANMSADQAAHYHAADQNYLNSNDVSKWQGEGAKELGLEGAIIDEEFSRLCRGIHPNKDEVLADTTKRAGTDLTFSAPKSLSVLAELEEDKDTADKLIIAHDRAVEAALKVAEQYAQTREQIDGERVQLNTNKLVIAKFRHDTSRENDPQIHTHGFVLNMTQKENGEWRALHNDNLFKHKMYLGQIYRNELAKNVKDLGYEIEVTNAKQGLWEIAGVNKELIKEFSSRAEQVKARATELRVQFPNLGEAELKKMATLDSRKTKNKNIDREVIKANNKARAAEILQGKNIREEVKQQKKNEMTTKEILDKAKEILTSKESLFSKEELIKESLKLSVGNYTIADIQSEIAKDKDIIAIDNFYSTREMVEIEKTIIQDATQRHNTHMQLANEEGAKKYIEAKYSNMTDGQKRALIHILTNKDEVLAIQGDAGAGKTYMLQAVKQYVGEAKIQGLAFTGKAAEQLQEDSGIPSTTLHSFLASKEFEKNQIFVVDEASMIGSKQMFELQKIAKQTNSSIVLIGDTKQFQTIQAGAIFDQLQQKNAVKTAIMDESIRAQTELMQGLYADIKEQKIDEAFERLEANELIRETTQMQEIVQEYLMDKDNSLLITSTNSDKDELNGLIRSELKLENPKEFTIRQSTQLDDIQRHYAENYKQDEIVFINKPVPGLKAGQEVKIKAVDSVSNSITVTNAASKEIDINLSKHGGNLASFQIKKIEIAEGEKILFTKNDKKLNLKNGQIGTVQKVDGSKITFTNEKKEVKTIDTAKEYNYIDYGYAITDYKSQGQTAKNVLVFARAAMAKANSFYVQITRAKESVKIFTDSKEDLKANVKNAQIKTTTLNQIKGAQDDTTRRRNATRALGADSEKHEAKHADVARNVKTLVKRAGTRARRERKVRRHYRKTLRQLGEQLGTIIQKFGDKLISKMIEDRKQKTKNKEHKMIDKMAIQLAKDVIIDTAIRSAFEVWKLYDEAWKQKTNWKQLVDVIESKLPEGQKSEFRELADAVKTAWHNGIKAEKGEEQKSFVEKVASAVASMAQSASATQGA